MTPNRARSAENPPPSITVGVVLAGPPLAGCGAGPSPVDEARLGGGVGATTGSSAPSVGALVERFSATQPAPHAKPSQSSIQERAGGTTRSWAMR